MEHKKRCAQPGHTVNSDCCSPRHIWWWWAICSTDFLGWWRREDAGLHSETVFAMVDGKGLGHSRNKQLRREYADGASCCVQLQSARVLMARSGTNVGAYSMIHVGIPRGLLAVTCTWRRRLTLLQYLVRRQRRHLANCRGYSSHFPH